MNKIFFCLLVFMFVIVSVPAAYKTKASEAPTQTSAPDAVPTQPLQTASTSSATGSSSRSSWWSVFGEPQYCDEISFAVSSIMGNFDNYNFIGAETNLWLESLFDPDWTLDQSIWPFSNAFIPDKYWTGNLAESWEMTDPQTVVVRIRKGIRWQNKAPVNGREFTAYDVQAHYDRLLGTGNGFTTPAPMYIGMTTNWDRVTAIDTYTIQFKFKKPSGGTAFQTIFDRFALNQIEAPEWVALGGPPSSDPPVGPPKGGPPKGGPPKGGPPSFGSGPLQDWHNAVGTGPWMLTDYVDGSKQIFTKNPDYWGHDPRYPQNRLPYADKLKMLVISDMSTKLAALRTAKIDIIFGSGPTGSVSWQQTEALLKKNPELQKGLAGPGIGNGVVFKYDTEPFTDIRVRQALQMSVNRTEIAQNLYGGYANDRPCGLVTQTYKGFCYSYDDWPQGLKDQYAYNPKKAKQLLKEAGYPDGFKTNVVTGVGGFGAGIDLLQTMKSYFLDIGVDMEIRQMDRVQAESYIRAGKHDQMAAHSGGADTPPTRTIDNYYSKHPEIGITSTNDPVYDAIRDKFWTAGNADEVAHALQEADKRVIEQHWGVWAVGAPTYNIWQPYLKGYSSEVLMWGQGLIWSRLWINKN